METAIEHGEIGDIETNVQRGQMGCRLPAGKWKMQKSAQLRGS